MDGQPLVRARVKDSVIEMVVGDITDQDTDVIVNAANSSLLGGGGVDGAIHRAAGPELLAETRQLGGCQTGDARITRGYNLKARHVAHAVGPIYQRQDPAAPVLLASAYRRSLEVAAECGARSIAFPAISTGIYGYPVEEAAPVALKAVADYLSQQAQIRLARFVLFNEATYQTFVNALARLLVLEVKIPAPAETTPRRRRQARRTADPG